MTTDIPETMRAIVMTGLGTADVLECQTCPVPSPRPGKLLVKVAAIGLNQADLLMRDPDAPLPLTSRPRTPGMELSGVVAALGERVRGFEVGDRVCGLTGGDACAEYCLVPQGLCWPVPPGYSDHEAAALTDGALTIWNCLYDPPTLGPGQTLLMHGGTSGMGIIGVIVAKAFGARVLATAGTDEKCRVLESLGVERAINYRKEDFVAACRAATGGLGADVLLDMVGGPYIERNVQALRPSGQMVVFGFMGGATGTLDVATLMTKNVTIRGASLFFLDKDLKARKARNVRERVWPLLPGLPRPLIDSVYPLEETAAAQRKLEKGGHIGKIVVDTHQ